MKNLRVKPHKPMTRKGYHALATEFNHLRDVERPKVVQGVADAAAEGDRSENAEYIYGKKRLREIDKRLRYLSGLLKDVRVVDPERLSSEKVCFGATALVRDADGVEKSYMLVGVGEADVAAGRISWESPVGKALIGKRVGDIVTVRTPAGEAEYEITELRFVS